MAHLFHSHQQQNLLILKDAKVGEQTVNTVSVGVTFILAIFLDLERLSESIQQGNVQEARLLARELAKRKLFMKIVSSAESRTNETPFESVQ